MALERIARRVELLLADARAALDGGEREEAHALATAILALDPGNAEADAFLQGSDQRFQVTLMFCDLVGSTELADACDPEETSAILREYRLLCTGIIGRYGGFIEDRQGDGLLVRFGYPWVHEDDARRAVLSGLEIVRAVQAHPRGLRVRIAVHTGLVVLDAGEVMGATPNEAARIQGLASPDTVVISDATHALVHDHFDVRSRGEARLRGVARAIEVFTVVGESAGERVDLVAGLTPFSGRRPEVRIIREQWARATAGDGAGPPPALLISGAAGIGKSRLARESARLLGARVLTCGCSSYRAGASLHPFVALLERICAIEPADAPRERLEKLRARIGDRAAGIGGDLPVLTTALGIPDEDTSPPRDVDPTQLRAAALGVAAELVRSGAGEGPRILLVEDLHWIDVSSLELLGMLLSAPCPGLLVLMTARQDFDAPWPPGLVPRVGLAPLPTEDLKRMARGTADGAGLDDELADELVARSDGIPLFLEELVRSSATVSAKGDPALWSASSRIPAALRDPLLARMVLPGVDLALVQTAATIGRDIDRGLLQRATGLPDKPFASKLANLVAAGLVDSVGDEALRFRHDLVRDAAYETQRHSTCRERHGRIADLLDADDRPGFGDAGQRAVHLEHAERYDEAVQALFAAARADQALGAHQEAGRRLTRVLALLEHLPHGGPRLLHELSARQLRSFSATMISGYSAPETAQDHARCVELCEHLGLAPELMPSLMLSCAYYTFRGDLAEASSVCATIRRVVIDRRLGPETAALAAATFGVVRFFAGELDAAEADMRGLVDHPYWRANEEVPAGWPMPHHPVPVTAAHLAIVLALRGDHEGALRRVEWALERCPRLGFPHGPFTAGYVNILLAVVRTLEGDFEHAAALGEQTAQLGARHGFALFSLLGTMQRQLALAHGGDVSQLEPLGGGIDYYLHVLSAGVWGAYWRTELGAAQLAAGRHEGARASLDEALRAAEATGATFYRSETLRVRGLLRREAGDPGGLSDLEQAIATARLQGAHGLELRAAGSLALQGARQTTTP